MMIGADVDAVKHGAPDGVERAAHELDTALVGMRPCSSGQSR
jgi:hypothetical protein